MTKPKRKTPEADLQIAIVEWFNLAYPDHAKWLHHSPNGGKRSISEAVRFKKMGTKAGFPDLVLYHPSRQKGYRFYNGLAIELKIEDNSLTNEQLAWIHVLDGCGFYVAIMKKVDDAIALLEKYMYPIKPRVKT